MRTATKMFGVTCAALLVSGCVRVDVMPMGSTRDGRNQFQVTCSDVAAENGACDREARAACNGGYETTGIGDTGPSMMTNAVTGQSMLVSGDRVQLITCHSAGGAERAE